MATDYGTDIALGVRSAPPNWSVTSGPPNVMNALARRYRTTRGTLFYDLEYGYNVTDLVGEDISEAQRTIAEIDIGLEAEKDPRVRSASATVDNSVEGTLLITVTGVLKSGVAFTLVLKVTSLTVEILT